MNNADVLSEPSPAEAAVLKRALEALTNYRAGSGRAALLPLDRAAAQAANDAAAAAQLERELLEAVQWTDSQAAREYVCSKLVLLGSVDSVPFLASLLPDAQLNQAARSALEVMACPQAAQALRDNLARLEGAMKIGVIDSLGARRDPESVGLLENLLKGHDETVVLAAAAALGNIATAKAAKVLRALLERGSMALRQQIADAVLTCAERLLAAGLRAQAQALYLRLRVPDQPAHVQRAAALGLKACAARL